MIVQRRWDPCVYHRGEHTQEFFREYLSASNRNVVLIAGAGFDPRSTRFAKLIAETAKGKIRAVLLREERPNPIPALVALAEANRDRMIALIPESQVHSVNIFAQDNAVVGGRLAASLIDRMPINDVTDIFVDASALSIGIAFPIIRHVLTTLCVTESMSACNLHVVCCDDPSLDGAIQSIPSATATAIHGFRGGWTLDSKSQAAILWMPQLSHGKQAVLREIFRVLRDVQPDTVVCPILPFPASWPRLSDELIEEFSVELQSSSQVDTRDSSWQVDARDLVFADEKSPLDLYRTVLRIDDARRRVFESVGGSQIILSPLGSKALSLGALMAALERDFTILYVESIGYSVTASIADQAESDDVGELVHIWLHGEAYGIQEGKEGTPQ